MKFWKKIKKLTKFVILMDVRIAVLLQDQTVLPVNMKTSFTANPLVSASTRPMFVMDILIQAVVGMMKVLIIV